MSVSLLLQQSVLKVTDDTAGNHSADQHHRSCIITLRTPDTLATGSLVPKKKLPLQTRLDERNIEESHLAGVTEERSERSGGSTRKPLFTDKGCLIIV